MNRDIQLGLHIRALRIKRGWNQEELAFRAGINKNYLSDLERGTRNPTFRILCAISDALEVSVATLVSDINI